MLHLIKAQEPSGPRAPYTLDIRRQPLSTSVHERGIIVDIRSVKRIHDVASRIALERNSGLLTGINVVFWNTNIPQHVRSLNDGGSQAHLNMPLDMAVQEVDTRVVCLEPENGVRLREDRDSIPLGWLLVVGSDVVRAWPVTSTGVNALKDLEVMAVKMERVNTSIMVVDNNVNNVSVADDERVHSSINCLVGVEVSSGRSGIESRDFGIHVRGSVDAVPIDSVLVPTGLES